MQMVATLLKSEAETIVVNDKKLKAIYKQYIFLCLLCKLTTLTNWTETVNLKFVSCILWYLSGLSGLIDSISVLLIFFQQLTIPQEDHNSQGFAETLLFAVQPKCAGGGVVLSHSMMRQGQDPVSTDRPVISPL